MGLNNHLLTHELRIILACIGCECSLQQPADIHKLFSKNTDWQLLIDYAKHHRLIPQVYNNLNAHYSSLVPERVLDQLKILNTSVIKQSLAQTAELKRIIPALNKNDINVAILKGRALARKLYGNISLRQSRDVDILIRQRDVISTDSVLHELGYELANQKSGLPLDSALGRRFIKGRSGLDYLSRQRNVCVDLHWHLAHSYHAFPIDMGLLWSQMQLVENEYGRVHELSQSMHFIFLCYHGAKHHWLRLHWLLDIAILMQQDNLDWDHIIDSAKQLGVLPTIILATILTDKFFAVPVPELLKRNFGLMNHGQKLAELMIRDIIRTPIDIENNVAPFMDFKRIKSGHRLQTKLKHRFLTWTDLLYPSDEDYQSVKLPHPLYILYYFIRPLRLTVKLVQRVIVSLTVGKQIPVQQ